MMTEAPHQTEAETAIETLLRYHNEGGEGLAFEAPKLAIVTCMDFRIRLRLPDNFAFVLRTGGANPEPIEPYLAFSVAKTGIHAIALIGHTDCAMAEPNPDVVNSLPTSEDLRQHYRSEIAALAVGDPASFTRRQAAQLEERFGLPVVPLLYRVENHKIERL